MVVDFCDLDGCIFLVILDYYSNYIEVVCIILIILRLIIKEFKVVFVRFGILEVFVIDNGV